MLKTKIVILFLETMNRV